MFLHSGASLHGHEYSHHQPNTPQNTIHRRSPLLRNPLVHPVSRAATMPVDSSSTSTASCSTSTSSSHPISTTTSRSSYSNSPRPSFVRPTRPLSEYTPRTEQVVRFKEPEFESDLAQTTPVPSYAPRPERPLSISFSPTVAKHPAPQQYREPQPQLQQQSAPRKLEHMSEDEGLSGSELSDASQANGTTERRKKRRQPRQSTVFLIAHPAPRQNAKPRLIQVRPKLLMQLQLISRDRRPRPAIDVFPSSIIAGSGIANRLSQRFPRVFRLRAELGIHDVLLVKSENYESVSDYEDSDNEEESIGRRELIAVLSPLAKADHTEIAFADGSVWVATPLPNGSFEFLNTDPTTGHLTTARWVRRTATKPLATGTSHSACQPCAPCPSPGPSPSPAPTTEYRYTFSIINPLSRRHPIMASLTPKCLDILESYTTVSTSSGRYPPTINNRSFTPGPSDDDDSGVSMPERTTQFVDDAMKGLISVTAVWVALRQGWSPYHKCPLRPSPLAIPEPSITPVPRSNTPSTLSARGRSLSTGHESQPPRSTPEPTSASTAVSIRDRLRHRPRDHSPSGLSLMGNLPRRATSTGAAFMQRRTQKRASTMVSDVSDAEKPAAPASRQRGFLSDEWNIPERTPRSPSPFIQPNDGGVKLDLHDQLYSGRRSADPYRTTHEEGGVPLDTPTELSAAANARLARQMERRSLPIPPRSGAATLASEKRRSIFMPDDGGVMVESPEHFDDRHSGYFAGYHDDHDEHGGVSIGPSTPNVYVEFEDKKRGKWKSLTSWLRKIGNR